MKVELNDLMATLAHVESKDGSTPTDIENLYTDAQTMEDFNLWLIGNFSNTLRRSFFVSLYSFLESQLVQECYIRRMLKGGAGDL